jgi:outer membrane protein assembly factor BamD (BamD/ComL family)
MIVLRMSLVLVVCLVLAACSSAKKNDSLTIKSLEGRRIDLKQDTVVQGGLNKAIESYRAFLESAANDPLRPEAMRRLADLEMEKVEAAQLRNAETLEKGITHESFPAARKLQPADYENAIALYQDLLEAYPDYPGNDQVLYQLAQAFEQGNDHQQALRILDRLVSSHPNAKFINEVQFRRGELLFVMKSYADAEQAYNAVLRLGGESLFYEKALYKHGWALFKQSRYETALDSFFALIDRKFSGKGGDKILAEAPDLTRAEKELMNDAFRVVTLSISYLDGANSISDYFKRNGSRPYEAKIYQNLGELYIKQERYVDAADTFNAFVRQYDNDPRAPLFQVKVMEAYKQGGFPTLLIQAKEEFVVRYGVESEFWRSQDEVTRASIAPHLRTNIEDLARHHHARAQKTKKPSDYLQAARWYTTFVKSFPKDGRTPAVNFLLAESLFDGKHFGQAALEYERTAYEYGSHTKGAEAGYAALLAHRKHAERLSGQEQAAYRRNVITSSLHFAQAFPKHKQAAAVLTKVAEDLFALNEPEQATAAAQAVIAMKPAPKARLRRTAWTVIAHSQFEKGTYRQAEQGYREVLKLTPQKDPERATLIERLASSVYKQGEGLRAAGDLAGAVDQFRRVRNVAPASKIVATAEYDAAAGLIALKDWQAAAQVLEAFRKQYPKHPLQKEVPQKLALAYVESSQWARAAAEFDAIANSGPDPKIRQQALWQAAELYDKASRKQLAANVYKRYITLFPGRFERAMEARYRLAEIYDAPSEKSVYYYWLKELVKGAADNGGQRTDRTQFLAAKAAFLLAEPRYQDFRGIRLVAPLKKSLKRKKQRMELALKAYGRVAEYGVAEFTTASTYRIAELYHSLSQDLLASERPKSLSAAELEQYEVLLEEQAYPFEEKAIEVHEANVRRVGNHIYDDWVKRSFVQLSKLRPVQYAKYEKSEVVGNGIQ